MIRWEQLQNRDWQGFSGELPVASVVRDPDAEQERWSWKIEGLKRPKGWRKPIGHRTTWLDARRSADAYWEKWLAAASLRPDLQRKCLAKATVGGPEPTFTRSTRLWPRRTRWRCVTGAVGAD
jgi:hypothetical protein